MPKFKNSFVWKFAAITGVALAFYFSSDAVRSHREKKKIVQELSRKLEEAKRANQKLESELNRLQTDPRLIGEIARRELGLLHPKEIEYRFVVRKSTF